MMNKIMIMLCGIMLGYFLCVVKGSTSAIAAFPDSEVSLTKISSSLEKISLSLSNIERKCHD